MRNGDKYAVAVRKPDQDIAVDVQDFKSVIPTSKITKWPLVRGVVSFVDSLVLGMKILSFSASFIDLSDDEDGETKPSLNTDETAVATSASKSDEASMIAEQAKRDRQAKFLERFSIIVGGLFAIGIFMILPYLLSRIFRVHIESNIVLSIIEGALRMGIFIGYLLLISRMNDIKRTFMYHGAEHKCISCIENGLVLNVENVRGSSKVHRRCGTSFLFFVVIVSIIVSFFITTDIAILRILLRLALLPLIAGISYEIIRMAGKSEHPFWTLLSQPGMWVQGITTIEPDDSMIEVAIKAVEAVFDWKAFRKENFHKEDALITANVVVNDSVS